MHRVSLSADQMPNSPPHLGQVVIISRTAMIFTPRVLPVLCFDGLSFICFSPSFPRETLHPVVAPVLELLEVAFAVRLRQLEQLVAFPDRIKVVERRYPPPGAVAFVKDKLGRYPAGGGCLLEHETRNLHVKSDDPTVVLKH